MSSPLTPHEGKWSGKAEICWQFGLILGRTCLMEKSVAHLDNSSLENTWNTPSTNGSQHIRVFRTYSQRTTGWILEASFERYVWWCSIDAILANGCIPRPILRTLRNEFKFWSWSNEIKTKSMLLVSSIFAYEGSDKQYVLTSEFGGITVKSADKF